MKINADEYLTHLCRRVCLIFLILIYLRKIRKNFKDKCYLELMRNIEFIHQNIGMCKGKY